jgi:hypothetical protein
MKKPKYSLEEISNLLQEIEKEKSSSPSGALSAVKGALGSFILREDLNFEAYQDLTAEALAHERKAQELRAIISTFICPMLKVPKLINDKNPIISIIARWRLLLGR